MVFTARMRPAVLIIGLCFTLLGCASIQNAPVNLPGSSAGLAGKVHLNFQERAQDDDVLLALSFSGGGTRAAAFSFGVLTELERSPERAAAKSLLDRVDFISGVSGGSVTAAYFGLQKRAALDDFRERFLLRNAEEGLNTSVSLGNPSLARLVGASTTASFPLGSISTVFVTVRRLTIFAKTGRPRVWINASDIYNRTPFVFGETAFDALCSDLTLSAREAVAASAAVPLAFAPMVIETFPAAMQRSAPSSNVARHDPQAPPMLQSFAKAMPLPRRLYVLSQAARRRPRRQFRPVRLHHRADVGRYALRAAVAEQAVKLRRVLFLVVDASPASPATGATVEGPTGIELVTAAAYTAIDASVGSSYTAFDRTMVDWQTP